MSNELILESTNYPSWQVTKRQKCDLELIMNGGFHPLDGFMSQSDYTSVLNKMRLSDGTLWSIPITLDVDNDFVKKINTSSKITLSIF